MKLCSVTPESIVVRSDDYVGTVAELAADYDLLILGASAERGWRTIVFGSQEHRIAVRVTCSVLSLKAPQDRVHHRLPAKADVPREDFAILPYLEAGASRPNLPITSKNALFSEMARVLNREGDADSEAAMLKALWDRELHQNTALAGGVALTAVVIPGLGTTELGVFTTQHSLDYGFSQPHPVDVVLAVLAPPEQRNDQLWLQEHLSDMVRHTDVVERLREASDERGLHAALEAAETAVEALPSSAAPRLP
jgi:mannitol/fructose-specific phosphotransferase system IIA component (Ntr-type)